MGVSAQYAVGRDENRGAILPLFVESCQSSLVDANGNPVELYNEDATGGLMIISPLFTRTGSQAEGIPLYAKNGIECRAQEHRFGGVVVQPLEAWKSAP
jgi:hypothetical protein